VVVTGVETTDACIGTGPVDAAFQAVNRLCGIYGAGQQEAESVRLTDYTVSSVTAGNTHTHTNTRNDACMLSCTELKQVGARAREHMQ
jgi:hypothetical protein